MDMRDRINERLEKTGLSVRGASIAAGLGETTLRNYLKGMTASLTVESAERLAAVLDCSATWLMTGTEPQKVVSIFDRIPEADRAQALRVLESFTRIAE
jgi:transcriptional regulator with XRE-family HTH domain